MSIFTEPIDRFYVGKMFFGLGFFRAIVYFMLSLFALGGVYHPRQGPIFRSPVEVLGVSGAEAVLTFVGFQLVERARRRRLNR
jgi:hypothetical protein